MKKILGVPFVKSVSLKVWLWNILEFTMCLLIPSLIILQITGYINQSNIPFYLGIIFMITGFIVNHLFKLFLNKDFRESYWSKSIIITNIIICIISGLALYEKIGF